MAKARAQHLMYSEWTVCMLQGLICFTGRRPGSGSSESNLRAPPDRCACVSEHVGRREPLQLRSSPSRWKGRTLLRQGDPAHRGARHSTQSAACACKEERRNRNGSQWHGERSQPISVRTWQAAAPSFSRLAWHANLTIGGGPHMRMSAAERGAQPTATVEPTTSHMQQP